MIERCGLASRIYLIQQAEFYNLPEAHQFTFRSRPPTKVLTMASLLVALASCHCFCSTITAVRWPSPQVPVTMKSTRLAVYGMLKSIPTPAS